MFICNCLFKPITKIFLVLFFIFSIIYSPFSFSYGKIPAECGYLGKEDFISTKGPSDYTNPVTSKHLHTVEVHHFTPAVEQLIKGNTSTHPPSDLHYTLSHFPNHHRALYSVIRYDLGNRKPKLQKTVDCYLILATTFKPKDSTAWMLWGLYLQRKLQFQEALKKYEHSEKINPNNAQLHYNMGLLFLQQKEYDQALKHAKISYRLGMKLSSLKRKLIKLEVWGK